jgi:hypothetical protein
VEHFDPEFERGRVEAAVEAFSGADHGERAGAGFAGRDDEVDVVSGGEPFSAAAGWEDGDIDGGLDRVGDFEFDEAGSASVGVEGDGGGLEVDWEGAEPVDFRDEFRGEVLGVHDGADGDDGGFEAIGPDRDEVHVMDVAGVGVVAGHGAAGGGEGDVFDAVADAVVAEAVDVAGEDGADIAGGFEDIVDLVPLGGWVGCFDPAWVVEEDEDVAEGFGFGEGALEPCELPCAHGLVRRLGEFALGAGAVALVREERDESAVLVLEPVVEGAEVFFEIGFVFRFRSAGTAPVDVMVTGDGEPWHLESVHGGGVLLHFLFPFREWAVAIDEVADGEDEVGVEEVGVLDGLVEHEESFGWSAGAVAEDHEVE